MEKKKINLKEIIGSQEKRNEITNIIQGYEVIRWGDITDQITNHINTEEFETELITMMEKKGYKFQTDEKGSLEDSYFYK